jgi:hypothetical protein
VEDMKKKRDTFSLIELLKFPQIQGISLRIFKDHLQRREEMPLMRETMKMENMFKAHIS